MLENIFDLLQNLNYNNIETLDLTKEEDNKKFKEAIQLVRDYKKEAENNSLMALFSNLIDDDILDAAEEHADKVLKEAKEEEVDLEEVEEENPCSVCEKEYCDYCPYFGDYEKAEVEEEQKLVRPSELLNNTDAKLQIHRLVNEYCDEYVNPYVSNDAKGKEIANNAYAGLFEFACWIFNKK